MTNYDRLYDMAHPRLRDTLRRTFPNILGHRGMREPRFELGYLAVPDPKSERADSDPEEKPLAGSLASLSATERHASPANAEQSTTESTTCVRVALSGERRTRP